jgi:SAM-dependent methyltransferase
MREYIYSLIDLAGVKSVLDIGCGKGHDLLCLAERLPNAAKLVGLDVSEEAIEAAKEAAQANGLHQFLAHDASQGLPFGDSEFDVVYSLNFLECVADKQTLVKEMHRVLSVGGQVVCSHFDWDTQVFDGVDKALVRKIVHAYADWQQAWMAAADGWMGRRLWGEFQRSGLFEGRIETYTLMNTEYVEPFYGHMNAQAFGGLTRRAMIAEDEYAAFLGEIEELSRRGEYFYSVNMYIYTGRKA